MTLSTYSFLDDTIRPKKDARKYLKKEYDQIIKDIFKISRSY